jgi:serine/threonine protein kinase/Flp pilus assembly protein TadD
MQQTLTDKTVPTPIALSELQIREAVECARTAGPAALINDFLPPPTDPQRLPMLLAILRADMDETESELVARERLAEYRIAFPILDLDSNARLAVASLDSLPAAVRPAAPTDTPPPANTPRPASQPAGELVPAADGLELTPETAQRLGFTDLTQLGRGGFGSVYLAKQPDLGHRLVAIKYTALPSRESQVLAALHHPNIVPVLSVHEHNGARVFCMPYHGKHTLADVLHQIDRTKSLPATGAGFLSTAAGDLKAVEPVAAVPATVTPPADQPPAEADDQWGYYETDRQRLSRLSYVDSVVMGMTRLADALVHAHSRRVIHLDIKPANILITDDGVFMILDFGLADHNGVGPLGQTGGTIRYMAPEQLAQFVTGTVRPDVRMDLYALGVVFFELLTGRHPYPASMAPDVPVHLRIAARHQPPPSVRQLNPSVSPTVEAIVHQLLQPDRALRYQSAEHLLTDLTRHQQHLPLKYTPNPSLWEQVAKFRRRHPVFAVALMALGLGLIALAAIGIAGKQAERAAEVRAKAEAAEAVVTADRLADQQNGVRIDAGSLDRRATRAAALGRVDGWLREYGTDDPGWRTNPGFARLTADRQEQVAAALVEQCLLAAHAERVNAVGQKPDAATAALDRAADWNRRAERLLAGRPAPPVLVEQRADLARLRGDQAPPPPDAVADESNLDLYLRALARIADREYDEAARVLQRLIAAESHHAAGQFALGVVYHTTGRFIDAAERYQVAKALAKSDPRPAFNRGTLLLYDYRYADAHDDLTAAIERDPEMVEAYIQRATARIHLRNLDGALADVDRAVALGGLTYRVCHLRYIVHANRRDATAAARDRQLLETLTPADELDYIARGFNVTIIETATALAKLRPATPDALTAAALGHRLEAVREQALADFHTATEISPLSATAWQRLAAVQDELGRAADTAASLEIAIRLLPGQHQLKFDRAVQLARLKRRDEALRQIAGVQPGTGLMWYQKACVHALSADTHLGDREEAFKALRMAVQNGFRDFDLMQRDEDLAHVRDLPDVQDLIRNKGRLAE